MKNFLFLLLLFPLCLSCAEKADMAIRHEEHALEVPLHLYSAPCRSSYDDSVISRISDANWYLFGSDGSFQGQGYFADASRLAVRLPDYSKVYTLYILANVGEVSIPSSTAGHGFEETFRFDYGSAENYKSMIAAKGVPMSAVMNGFGADCSDSAVLDRLVQTLYIDMDTDALNASDLSFTGVEVRQAARDILPFAAGSKALNVMDLADYATAADLDELNAGGAVRLYVLENMRGDLLPGNADWSAKVPVNLPADESALATYIELSAEMTTPTAVYANNVYRAYLGVGAGNFDVQRNSVFYLTNSFTNDMVTSQEWRQEADEPETTGTLEFCYPAAGTNDYSAMQPSRTVADREFALMYGFRQTLYIRRSNRNIRFGLSASKADTVFPYLSYSLTAVNDYYYRLDIWPSRYIRASDLDDSLSGYRSNCLYDPATSFPVRFTVTSDDGLLGDSVTCYVLCQRFCPVFDYSGYNWSVPKTALECGEKSNMRMKMWNPLKFRFNVTASGSVDSYIAYYPNWYNTKPTVKTYNMPYSYATSGIPDMGGMPIDCNRYNLADPAAGGHDLTGYAARYLNSSWSPTLVGMTMGLVYQHDGTSMKEIVERDGCNSMNDACAYLQLNGVYYTETGMNSGSYRASRPKHVDLRISLSMDRFSSGQPGLSYMGSFNSTSIFNYLTFSRIVADGGVVKPLGPTVKYRVLLDSGDSFAYGGYTWYYKDYTYTQVSAKSWKAWSDMNDTNILDFSLNNSAPYLTYECADIGQ